MQSYAYGDYIDANCTSDQSNPPSELSWFVDERKVSESLLINNGHYYKLHAIDMDNI